MSKQKQEIINCNEYLTNASIQQRMLLNPKSPLFSVKTFEALRIKPELLKGLYAMGFNAPSRIQETTLPILLADEPKNMIAQSQSGTGKTVAFSLAMLSRVNTNKPYPQVLCILPTYELAIQTGEVVARMKQFSPDIKIRYAVRGEQVSRNEKITEHILIGTPGKLLDWSIKYKCFDMSKIIVFVLDEADVMISLEGHQDQCLRIHKALSINCQMLFFSATYEQKIMNFAADLIVSDPIIIRLPREEECLDNIKQFYCWCVTDERKYQAILNIYGGVTIGQAIMFCDTRRTASWLAQKMTNDGYQVAVLSGELSIEARLNVLDRFRSNLEKVLITTNVLSRGIDIEQVTIVVNVDMPVNMNGDPDFETYLHRIGRTGRFGKPGIAINLIDSDKSMKVCNSIQSYYGKEITYFDFEDEVEIDKIGK